MPDIALCISLRVAVPLCNKIVFVYLSAPPLITNREEKATLYLWLTAMAKLFSCCIPFLSLLSSSHEDGHQPTSPESGPQCDETPISGSSNVSMISEGEKVEVHLNVSGVPGGDKAPSSSSSSLAVKSDVINMISHDIVEVGGKKVPVDLDKLMEHIAQLLQLIEEEKPTRNNGTRPAGSDWKALNEIMASGAEFFSELKEDISGAAKEVIKVIGKSGTLVTAGLLVVAYTLERFDDLSTNTEDCLHLLKEMSYVASVVKFFKESPEGMQNIIEEATTLIVEGAIMCAAQIVSSPWKSFFLASKYKEDLKGTTQKLVFMYSKINVQIGIRALTTIERKGKSPLPKEYPTHAVGMDKSITEVLDLLECESKEKVVTVILHGFGGMGKTTLADAVFSRVGGCNYSHIQLFEDVNAKPDIIDLQKKIFKDLMGTEEPIPDIRKYQNGQRVLETVLEKVQAFIYIDNVLEGDMLKKLLPEDMVTTKKVRFLLTARDENVKKACPRLHTNPKIYRMKGIPPPEARLILEKKIKEGIDESQFEAIIKMCGEIPLMLTLAGPFIGHADNKQEAYSTLMKERGKWKCEEFKELHCTFAYEALPGECKDPFLDICSFFKGWNWETVADIVGKNELDMLRNRALVTKGTNEAVIVHDVILSMGLQKTEGSRMRFSNAREIKELLDDGDEKDIQEIKGIWLSGNTDLFEISASKLNSMHRSLRVLALGSFVNVLDKCNRPFTQLVYLQAAIPYLPFDVSKSKGLRYLNYQPKNLNFSEIPSHLRQMKLDGSLHSRAFEISSSDLQELRDLRILSLTHFAVLKKFPQELGDLTCLRELTLSHCSSLKELPESISKLASLRLLRMDHCSSLSQLPKDFGKLSSLQEIYLEGCKNIETLPDSFDKLTVLRLLDLSSCERLMDLPHCLGNLTSIAKLYLKECSELRNIPESIGQMKSLGFKMDMSGCSSLKELPNGFCDLSFIKVLSLASCNNLEKLPDRFGELASLGRLELQECTSLKKLPEGLGQLKYLTVLFLEGCSNLEELCNDFHCLVSLEHLDLDGCHSLKKLPEEFDRLASMRRLYLADCPMLEGKEMDKVVKMQTLHIVTINDSEMLLKRWGEIQREGNLLRSSGVVFTGEDLAEDVKENIEKNLLSEFDCLLRNEGGGPFHLSDHLREDSLLLLIFDWDYDFPWPLFEETIDEMQTKFEIIYVGDNFNEVPRKVKGKIVGHGDNDAHGPNLYLKMCLTSDLADRGRCDTENVYFQIRRKMVGDEKSAEYRPCWKLLTNRELEELLLSGCRSYQRLTQLALTSGESNIELLRELFASGNGQDPHIFQKNYASQQVSNENSKPFASGVEELEGKMIFLEMRPIDMCYDIRLGSLIELYNTEKESLNLEIISIPLVQSNDDIRRDAFEQFSGSVPWLVLQNPSLITRAVKYFLIKECLVDGAKYLWDEEVKTTYKSIITIIEPDGKIFTPSKAVLPVLDRWGIKAYPFTSEKIKELEEEEESQMEAMSNLEFLFHNQKSILHQVKDAILQQKMTCLFGGNDSHQGTSIKELTGFLRNALIEFSDSIQIIYIPGFGYKHEEILRLTDTIDVSHYPLENDMPQADMDGIPLLNVSMHDAIRFWTWATSLRLGRLKINGNDKKWDEFKRFMDSFVPYYPRMILIDKDEEMVTKNGKEIISLCTRNMEDQERRLLHALIKGSKEEKQQALIDIEKLYDDDDDDDEDDDDDDDDGDGDDDDDDGDGDGDGDGDDDDDDGGDDGDGYGDDDHDDG